MLSFPGKGEREEKKANVTVVQIQTAFFFSLQVVLFKAFGVPAVWMCHCAR